MARPRNASGPITRVRNWLGALCVDVERGSRRLDRHRFDAVVLRYARNHGQNRRLATLGTGAGAEKMGAHLEHRSSAGPNKNVANKKGANRSVAGKEVSGAAVKP